MKDDLLKKRALLLYDLIFCALALFAVYTAVQDIVGRCSGRLRLIDNVITVIFIVDYMVRLCLADRKMDFVKENILDLIATIPFSSLLKIFRVFKILRLLKFLKLARLSAYLIRFYRRVKFFFDLNGLKYMVIVCVICICLGGIAIHFTEGMSIPDGLWWSFVTATTVGYGDLSPVTASGRIIAAILMIVGIGLIGSLTSTITALFFRKQEKHLSFKENVISDIQSQLDDFDSLSDDDIDTICSTLKTLHNK